MDEPTTPPAPASKRNPRAGKPPAFQFYPADWLADAQVRSMTYEERGVYIDLLAYCWREGSIPTETPELARLLQLSAETTARIWHRVGPRFNPDGTHRRHEAERRKQRTFSRLQSERARKRWDAGTHNAQSGKQDPGTPPALPRQSRNDALQSASASASSPIDELPGRATEGSPNGVGRVQGGKGQRLNLRPLALALGPTARPVLKPVPKEIQIRATAAIETIDTIERVAPDLPFKPAKWWFMGRKLDRNRDPEAMVLALESLIRKLNRGERPSDCFAYLEIAYSEKEAKGGMARAEAESAARREPGREEPRA